MMRDEIPPMPKSVVRAIAKIMATVDAVKKSQRNSHGGYLFSSTDDVYAALARKMGEVGLAVLSLEDEHEIVRIERDGKTSQWLRVVYSFVLATEEDTWSHPKLKRSLYIQVTGPQTHQAAQSFCEKAFFRSLFKLPSGDMDLDGLPQAETEEDMIALVERKPRKSSAEGKRDGSVKRFNEVRASIEAAEGPTELHDVRVKHAEWWASAPRAWAETLDEDFQSKMRTFGIEDGELFGIAAE